jgi:rhodanese-related sulfurtransferase
MQPNPDFLDVVGRAYAKDAKLVLGCKAGGRSQRAAMMMEAAGFTHVVEMRGGFGGEVDGMGRLVEKGWAAQGLPVDTGATPGGTWDELRGKK